MKNLVIFLSILCLIFTCAKETCARNAEDTIAYKLATIHTRNLNPERYLLEGIQEPERSTVAEFQWILGTLRNRCVNSEGILAEIILKSWQTMRKWGYQDFSLLDTARSLATTTRNMLLFGPGKVNFKKTANYWLAQRRPPKE